MLVDDVVKEFIFELQVKNYTPRTIKGYKNNILKFIEYFKQEFEVFELEEINHIHIKKYFQYLLSKGRSSVYVNNILKNIRSFFKYCYKEEYIHRSKGRSSVYVNNILKNIRSFFKYCYKEEYIHRSIALKVEWQREKRTVIKTFTDEEVQGMLGVYTYKNYLETRNKCIMAVLFYTGTRNLELCTLGMLDIKDTVIYIKGKGRKESVVPISPMLKVEWQREKRTVIKTFTDEEVQGMLGVYTYKNYLETRNKCIMAVLFYTGTRNLELCTLGMLDIKDTVIYIKGKGRKESVVPISPMLKKIMIKYERAREEYIKDSIIKDDAYFLSYRGKRMTGEAVERIVKLCGKEAKIRSEIRCSPHTCRHYFAQAQLRNGLDVYSLSRLLGHEDISITKRYLQGLEDKNIIEISVKTSPLMNLRIK